MRPRVETVLGERLSARVTGASGSVCAGHACATCRAKCKKLPRGASPTGIGGPVRRRHARLPDFVWLSVHHSATAPPVSHPARLGD